MEDRDGEGRREIRLLFNTPGRVEGERCTRWTRLRSESFDGQAVDGKSLTRWRSKIQMGSVENGTKIRVVQEGMQSSVPGLRARRCADV